MAKNLDDNAKKRLRDYLPAIYQEEPGEKSFFGDFMQAFEAVLLRGRHSSASHRAEEPIKGLQEKIEFLPDLLDPKTTLVEFLPWLASWAALNLRADLSIERKRALIAEIVTLYRIRGTRKYVERLIMLYLGFRARVDDMEAPPLQVGVYSSVGKDTYISGGPPYFFRVVVAVPEPVVAAAETYSPLLHSVIELAKPAHTYYELEFVSHHTERDMYISKDPDPEIRAV
jgi:phage tail-like protein